MIKEMDFVRDLCSGIHAARKLVGIPTIQPLQEAVLYKSEELEWFLLYPYRKIIQDECNIKNVHWEIIFDGDYEDFGLTTESRLNFKDAGKILGKETQKIGSLIRDGLYSVDGDEVVVGGIRIPGALVEVKRTVNQDESKDDFVIPVGLSSFLVLDTSIYPMLYLEKLAQEMIKLINGRRREDGYSVSDIVEVDLKLGVVYYDVLTYFKDKMESEAKCKIRGGPLDIGESLEITHLMRV